jgi:hypothetical protein
MLLQTSATLRWTLVVVAPTPDAGTSIFIASTVDPVATPIPTGTSNESKPELAHVTDVPVHRIDKT